MTARREADLAALEAAASACVSDAARLHYGLSWAALATDEERERAPESVRLGVEEARRQEGETGRRLGRVYQ